MFPRLAVLIGGFAAGTLMRRWLAQDAPARVVSLDRIGRELKAQVRSQEARLGRLETQSERHESLLREMPTRGELIAAMDDLLGKALSGLDTRLTAQARSIETLQMTVTQTDELLERVLESLDTLHETPPGE